MSQFDWVIPVQNQEEKLSPIKVTNQFTSKKYEEDGEQISEDEESFLVNVCQIFFLQFNT